MTDSNSQLAIQSSPHLIQSLDDMDRVSKSIAASGMFGITKPEQALTLMLICQAEGLNPVAALRRYHLIENKPAMRADAMAGEFEAKGAAFIWHVRSDMMVACTAFINRKVIDDAARARANARFELLWKLDNETDAGKQSELMVEISKLSREGEETLIRTFADACQKGIAIGKDGTTVKANWATSPRQMLTARVVTELVRLLNPGLIAGIYSEDETMDIIQQEKLAQAKMLAAPSKSDVTSILEIIAGYDAELSTDIPDSRRKTLLGLRSDLVCKLGDIGEDAPVAPHGPAPTVGGRPVTVVESVVVEPAAPVAHAPKKEPAKRKAEPAPAVVESEPAPAPANWQDVKCHIGFQGKPSGKLTGLPMSEIFTQQKSDSWIASTIAFFHKHLDTSPIAQDKEVLAAAVAAHKAWTEERAKSGTSTPETPASTATAPATTEAPPVPAQPTGWRAYVIEGSLAASGHKMEELTVEAIQKIKTDYLDKVPDPSRMTLKQKKLAAMVSMALAELTPGSKDLPPAANEEAQSSLPDHTVELLDAIESSRLNRNDFMKVCRDNGYISATATRPEDITQEEYIALTGEWATVVADVQKAQP